MVQASETQFRHYDLSWPQLLDKMRDLLRKGIQSSYIRDLAEQIVRSQPDQILTVYNFVKTNYPYMPDPIGKELIRAPHRLAEDYLVGGKTYGIDCEEYALYTASLLGSIGYQTRIAIVDLDGRGYGHAYAEVYHEDTQRWIPVDEASSAPLGWVFPHVKVIYLEV